VASVLFALALLASGQNSTLTGTLAGQIVMEGFLNIRIRPWLRRLITRLIAIVPAVIVTLIYGTKGTTDLLVLSQVILSLQLSFAVVPLVLFTGSRKKMGQFANPLWVKFLAWLTTAIIVLLNVKFLFDKIREWTS
jgi:manganese transport protein